MPNLDHVRWHLALAFAGALMIERLHGPLLTGLLALVIVDRGATIFWRHVRQRRKQVHTSPNGETPVRRNAGTLLSTPLGRAHPRQPRALAQALDADCEACRGFGCRSCAYTGRG